VAPASGDHCGDHCVPPRTSLTSGGGVIPGFLPASEIGDAAPPSLLTTEMLLRLYPVVVGVVAAPPEDVNTSEWLEQILEMRPELVTIWVRGQRRGVLMRLDTAALLSAGLGTEEATRSTPGTTFGANRAPSYTGSAWATRLAGLPDFLIRDPTQTYDSIVSAPVIRAPVEDEYPRWLAASVSRFRAMATLPEYPNLLYIPVPDPYLRRLPILTPSYHANSEQRARRRGFLMGLNHQEFWSRPPVTRPQFFAAVPTWFAQMETPIGFITGVSLMAYYARDEIYRS